MPNTFCQVLRNRLNKGTPAALIDAAILWAYCPKEGGYKDGWSIEDTCEQLDEAVEAFTGVPRPDAWWTEEEMRAALATKPAETAKEAFLRGVLSHPTESAGKSPTAADADRADARRYRWLRSPKATNDWNRLGHYGVDELDAQIDTAIAETQRSSNANGSDEQTSPSVQPPAPKPPTLEQFISALDAYGWHDYADAQHERIAELHGKLFATPSIAQRGAALTDEQIVRLWLRMKPASTNIGIEAAYTEEQKENRAKVIAFARALSPERPE